MFPDPERARDMKFNNWTLATPASYRMAATVAAKPRKQRASAAWTMFGTWAVLLTFAIFTDGFVDFWQVLSNLLSGDANMAQLHSGELMRMAPTIAAMVSIDLVLMVPIAMLVSAVVKIDKKEDKRAGIFQTDKPKAQYAAIMTTLGLEEAFARWLFLGFIGQLAWFTHSNVAFYVLFFVGNGLWAAIHLANIAKKGKEFPIKKFHQMVVFVLPQFVGGIMITAIYLPYGLVGALIAHIVFDMVLFASDRVDVFNRGEKLVTAYNSIVAAICLTLFTLNGNGSLLDMKRWLDDDIMSFSLPGWTFWDYALAIAGLMCIIIVSLEVLQYDREGGTKHSEFLKDWVRLGTFMAAACFIAKGAVGMTYLSLGGVVITLAICSTFFVKSRSGSGLARLFWESVLIGSLVISGMLAMDERHGLYLVCFIMVLLLPDRYIRFYDEDELPEEAEETEAPDAPKIKDAPEAASILVTSPV